MTASSEVVGVAVPVRSRGVWSALSTKLRKFTSTLTDAYRPELHYMRGPGPKWYAKHGQPMNGGSAHGGLVQT